VATVRDGENPGRQGGRAQRQSPAPERNGRAEPSLDPTEQLGQTPPDIFGFAQSYHTGAPGSPGARGGNADVTIQAGQLDEGLSGVTGEEITSTGLHGSQGGSQPGGGEGIRYTDPFGYMGNEHRESHSPMQIGGASDSTKGIDGTAPGPTLPVLENNRPVDTGAGEGHVTGAPHPNAMSTGPQPRNGNRGDAAGPSHPNAGR
jgi:hypothetical protein